MSKDGFTDLVGFDVIPSWVAATAAVVPTSPIATTESSDALRDRALGSRVPGRRSAIRWQKVDDMSTLQNKCIESIHQCMLPIFHPVVKKCFEALHY